VSIFYIVERHLGRGLGHKWLEMAVDIDDDEGCKAVILSGNSRARRAAGGTFLRGLSLQAASFPWQVAPRDFRWSKAGSLLGVSRSMLLAKRTVCASQRIRYLQDGVARLDALDKSQRKTWPTSP
jgi:hypothetical protein